MKKFIEIGWVKHLFQFIGLVLFFKGMFTHDWIFVIGGFLLNFTFIRVIHYQASDYDNKSI